MAINGDAEDRLIAAATRPARSELFRKARQGQLCFILGNRGSGKTHFVYEYTQYLERKGNQTINLDFHTFFEHFDEILLSMKRNQNYIDNFEPFWNLVIIAEILKASDGNFSERLINQAGFKFLLLFTASEPTPLEYWDLWISLKGKASRRGPTWYTDSGFTHRGSFDGFLRRLDVDSRGGLGELAKELNYIDYLSFLEYHEPRLYLIFDGINSFKNRNLDFIEGRFRQRVLDEYLELSDARIRAVRDCLKVLTRHVSFSRSSSEKTIPLIFATVETGNAYWFRILGKETNKSVLDYGTPLEKVNREAFFKLKSNSVRKYLRDEFQSKYTLMSYYHMAKYLLDIIKANYELFDSPNDLSNLKKLLNFEYEKASQDDELLQRVATNLRRKKRSDALNQLRPLMNKKTLLHLDKFLEECFHLNEEFSLEDLREWIFSEKLKENIYVGEIIDYLIQLQIIEFSGLGRFSVRI